MADSEPQAQDPAASSPPAHPISDEETAAQPPAKRGRPTRPTRDFTKGSIRRHLWFLGWPQVAEGSLSVVDHFAELIWAGRLGFQAIAGLGVAQTYLMMFFMIRMGLDSAMRSMISRAVGARNISYANHILLQSLTLNAVYAVAMIIVGQFFTEPMLRIIGLSDAVVDQAAGYMRIQFIAMAVLSFHRSSAGALQAAGDSMTPLKAGVVTRVTHLVLTPLLIFGWLGLPAFGLAGAAIARLAAEWIGLAINFTVLFRGSSRLQLSLKGYHLDLRVIWRLVKLGVPASVTNMQRGLSQLVVVGIVAPFGDVALAGFSLTRRTENLANQGARGLGRAAGTLAGQNLAVGMTDRARASVRWALVYIAVGSLVLTAVILRFPESVASFFNSEPRVRESGGQVDHHNGDWIPVHEHDPGVHAGLQHQRRHDRANVDYGGNRLDRGYTLGCDALAVHPPR